MFRNVLERRRELGFCAPLATTRGHISIVIVAEVSLLVGAGLLTGVACAALAIAPAWLSRQQSGPGPGLLILLVSVAAAGLLSSLVAVRAATHGRILEALSAE